MPAIAAVGTDTAGNSSKKGKPAEKTEEGTKRTEVFAPVPFLVPFKKKNEEEENK